MELTQKDVDVFIKCFEEVGLETNSNRSHFGTDPDRDPKKKWIGSRDHLFKF